MGTIKSLPVRGDDTVAAKQGLVGLVEVTTFLELCLEIARR